MKAVLIAVCMMSASFAAAQDKTDLTITVAGDLWALGGVVTVYPLPVPAEEWERFGGDKPREMTLTSRYTEVQLKYPEDGTFTYRFRPVEGVENADAAATQVLSIIGTDGEGRGPQMTQGFTDAYSSGGRVIRVPSIVELAGDMMTTNPAWGTTLSRTDTPPADERSARVLAGVMQSSTLPMPMVCDFDGPTQACTPAPWDPVRVGKEVVARDCRIAAGAASSFRPAPLLRFHAFGGWHLHAAPKYRRACV